MKRQHTRFRVWNQVSIYFAKQFKYSTVRSIELRLWGLPDVGVFLNDIEDQLREQLKRDIAV
jgi:hypothetical protein